MFRFSPHARKRRAAPFPRLPLRTLLTDDSEYLHRISSNFEFHFLARQFISWYTYSKLDPVRLEFFFFKIATCFAIIPGKLVLHNSSHVVICAQKGNEKMLMKWVTTTAKCQQLSCSSISYFERNNSLSNQC